MIDKKFGYHDFQGLQGLEYVNQVFEPVQVVPGKDQALFDLIFAVNPLTGLPDGDLAIWMSENTSPDIKRFIELNLHSPVASDAFESRVDDDTLAEFVRGSDESLSDYRDRLVDYVRRSRSEYLKSKDA